MSISVYVDNGLVAEQVSRLHLRTGNRMGLINEGYVPGLDAAQILVESNVSVQLSLAAIWPEVGTGVGLGTSYVDLFSAVGLAGFAQDVDFTNAFSGHIVVWWTYAGLGDHSLRVLSATNDVLVETGALATGRNQTSFISIPAAFTSIRQIRLQAKSTVGTDVPILRAAALYLNR